MVKWNLSQGCIDIQYRHIIIIHHINILKNNNCMITSIDVEKTFGKIQHRFMIKTLQKVGTEGIDLNIIKALCDKLIRKDPDAGKD